MMYFIDSNLKGKLMKLNKNIVLAAALISFCVIGTAADKKPVSMAHKPEVSCSANLKEGTDYQKVEVPASASIAQKMQKDVVIEFFSYACIHCANLYPAFHKTAKEIESSTNSRVVYMPVIFRPDWEVGARLFYALEELKLNTVENNDLIFKTIHTKHEPILNKKDEMEKFLATNFGPVKSKEILTSMFAFSMTQKINAAKAATAAYKIDSTPAIVVDKLKGEQFRTDVSIAKTPERLMQVIGQFAKNECK